MPYLIIVLAILFVESVQSVQQFEDLADVQTPSELNYPSDISVSNKDALAYANIDFEQNEPNGVSSDLSPYSADRDKPDISSSPLINPAATSESTEVAIGGGGGFGRGESINGDGGGFGKGGGIGGIGRPISPGIIPPEWWQDLAPPVCKETSSDGKLKTPACCGRPRQKTKSGRLIKVRKGNEGDQFECRRFSSYTRDCYNAGMVFCCKKKFEGDRKGIECNRPGEGYPKSGSTPVRPKVPVTPLAPPNLPAEQVAPKTNLPADRVIDPQIEINIPGAVELGPIEGAPGGALIEP